jgi:hypothetical protein
MSNTPKENYPFVTKDGKVIPLDILRAEQGIVRDVGLGETVVTLPAGTEFPAIAVVYASQDMLISFDAATAVNAFVSGQSFIAKGHYITFAVPTETIRLKMKTTAGFAAINLITRWAGLDLDISYTKR